MKLARVILSRGIRLPGMREAETEITSDMVDGGIRYDEKLQVVVFGDVHRPREQVVEWSVETEQLVCPECGKDFANSKALGSHIHFKHEVGGKGAA